MSDRNGESRESGGRSAEEEAALQARLRRLGDALAKEQQEAEAAKPASRGDSSGLGLGLRLASELVAGVLVGGGLGWLLDRGLGTSPFGLIVFLLGGFAAGIFGMLRATGMMKPPSMGDPKGDDRDGGRGGPPA